LEGLLGLANFRDFLFQRFICPEKE
jgi:hypothetical protein